MSPPSTPDAEAGGGAVEEVGEVMATGMTAASGGRAGEVGGTPPAQESLVG